MSLGKEYDPRFVCLIFLVHLPTHQRSRLCHHETSKVEKSLESLLEWPDVRDAITVVCPTALTSIMHKI